MSLPRSNSHTPLQQFNYDYDDKLRPMSLNPHVAHLLAALNPRKPKHRTTFVALFILVSLTSYLFIAHSTFLPPLIALRSDSSSSSADQLALALETIQNSRLADVSNGYGMRKGKGPSGPPLTLDAFQELAAISSFLASLPQNVIPPNVDPALPIDPQLVLDFDTRSSRSQEEVRAMVEDVWLRNPVFVYSKFYSSSSRDLKSILSDLYLRPPPTIIDVDLREDANILTPILKRLTSSPNLPVLLIGGKPVHSVDKIRELEKSGELQKMITAAGSHINGAKRKHRK